MFAVLENLYFSIFSEFFKCLISNFFKNLLRRNYWSDSFQIWYGASLGQCLPSLFTVLRNLNFSIFSEFLKLLIRNFFKNLLLLNYLLDSFQILCAASLGQCLPNLFTVFENFNFSIFSEFLKFLISNFSKNLLLRNFWSDSFQIWYGASLGQCLPNLFTVLRNFNFSIFSELLNLYVFKNLGLGKYLADSV